MKVFDTRKHRGDFEPLAATRTSQAAMMTLAPGETSQEQSANEHAWAEQWLYVVSGSGTARVGTRSVHLHEGSLLRIDKREPHRIHNTGKRPLITLNVYAPPAYTPGGEPRRPTSRSRDRRSSRSS